MIAISHHIPFCGYCPNLPYDHLHSKVKRKYSIFWLLQVLKYCAAKMFYLKGSKTNCTLPACQKGRQNH